MTDVKQMGSNDVSPRENNICEQSKNKEIIRVLLIDVLQCKNLDALEYWKEYGDESISSFAFVWRTTLS